jgi:copper transport protein
VVGGRQLVIPLRGRLAEGDYTVLWRALSDDGHSLAGVLTFAIGTGRPRPQAALTAPGQTSPVELFARWLFLAGVLTASGAALFTLALRRAPGAPPSLYVAGFLLVVAGAPLLAARASLATRFGVVMAAATAVAAAGALIATFARGSARTRGTVIAALLLLVAPSLSGHALDASRSPLELPVDVLHVAASSVWLGGLLALVLQLRAGTPGESVLRAFSSLAVGAVALLAATGLLRAFSELTSFDQAWGTGYGRVLLIKTLLFGLLLVLGWINRYRIIPAATRSIPRLRRNMLVELALFAGLVTAVAFLTEARPGRDRGGVLAAPATAAIRPAEVGSDAVVLEQDRGALQVAGRAQSARAEDAGHLIWATLPSEASTVATVVRRDLRARRSTTLARNVAPLFGLAVAGGWAAFVTATAPPQLVAVRTGGGDRQVLSRAVAAPIASDGSRVAWAEQQGGRQRIVVRDMAQGKDFVAADVPACDRAGCYRIDAVTLADRGVVVARGAIGPQPSSILRREFTAPRAESVRLPDDPQPDLIASSAGAAYFALGRGWYRWDFGAADPVRASDGVGEPSSPIAYQGGRWYVQRHGSCGDTIVVSEPGRRTHVVVAPKTVLALAGNPRDVCPSFIGLSVSGGMVVTSWAISPVETHSEARVTGVILFRPADG